MQQEEVANSNRLDQAEQWLKKIGYQAKLEKKLSDASYRHYWRLRGVENKLLMDAPPNLEATQIFADITERIRQSSITTFKVPEIFAHEQSMGFLLLEDLGDNLLSECYKITDPDLIISLAIEALSDMQKNVNCIGLKQYGKQQCLAELSLFTDWYLAKHLQIKLSSKQQQALQQCYDLLYTNFIRQPKVFVHRDYHCRNLFYFKDEVPPIATIDYQDAIGGPQCYDLVSLLKDAYYELSDYQVTHHLKTYWQHIAIQIRPDWPDFLEAFHLTCLQRHLKVLGIFCRLNYRDKKPQYLLYLALVKKYALATCEKYPQKLSSLTELLSRA